MRPDVEHQVGAPEAKTVQSRDPNSFHFFKGIYQRRQANILNWSICRRLLYIVMVTAMMDDAVSKITGIAGRGRRTIIVIYWLPRIES